MTVDLTGRIDPARENVFAVKPENPEMRDSVSFWVLDDRGEVALPRIGVEAVSNNWDNHDLQVNVALADGRVYRLRDGGPSWPVEDTEGRPRVLGAGGLGFQCVDPFNKWTMTYEGKAVQTTSAGLLEGKIDGPLVNVSFRVEGTMAAPPWIQGSLQAEAADKLKNSVEGGLMGGDRYEQLFRASGELTIDNEETHTFSGNGLRIRRQGVRQLAGFWGHCWQSAVFPSGRAFGYIAYPPRADGQPTFNEGFIFLGDGKLIPARITKAPWLSRLRTRGEDVSLTLETADGVYEIAGETAISTHDVHHSDKTNSMKALKAEMPDFPVLQQASVRYTWDNEQTYGMLERSIPREKLESD
ncbi:hypothetical protein [Nocardia sp. 348MFTsu5.1]|uniref:hypothetical protein n=1 Tax=Nocardia sp. 348MFTsu5.1 TaxID=1172185 RepID=UPI00035C2C48|nr:hypothetical protein [Nocardia sp. 348MFTsu5.1]